MSLADKDYINSKIWKDENDIKDLSEYKIDKEKLNYLLKENNFKKYFTREIERLNIKI